MHVNISVPFYPRIFTRFLCAFKISYTLCVETCMNAHIYILQRGAKFVVMVRFVQIKGVRMLMEHLIATLPDRKVRRSSPLQPVATHVDVSPELMSMIICIWQLVLEAMATVVCLNQDYRPTRMFPEMANLLHFFSHPN
jgi:hypothetical protein